MAQAERYRIKLSASDIPECKELLRATHVLLVHRLHGLLDTPGGLRAWNDLIAAHDALVDRAGEGGS